MMIISSGRVQRFLLPDDILNNLYPGLLTLVTPTDPRSIVVPKDTILVDYNKGTRTYGGNPALRIGYPDALSAVALFNAGIDNVESWEVLHNTFPSVASVARTVLINKPLVISFDDPSTTYGPIATSSKVSGGADYAENDEFEFDADTGATGKVLTVAAITGAVLTYSILTPGTVVPPGTNATTATSGIGTGLTISVTPTQGNGSLYIEFGYDVIRIPVLCGTSPIWPIQ